MSEEAQFLCTCSCSGSSADWAGREPYGSWLAFASNVPDRVLKLLIPILLGQLPLVFYIGVSIHWASSPCGVHKLRHHKALLLGVYIGAPDFWKLPYRALRQEPTAVMRSSTPNMGFRLPSEPCCGILLAFPVSSAITGSGGQFPRGDLQKPHIAGI